MDLSTYEKAIAGQLDLRLKGTKTRLWADVFSTDERAQQNSMIYCGISSVSYGDGVWDPEAGGTVWPFLIRMEVQAKIFTLQNHAAALQLISDATRAIAGYKPYQEIEQIRPIQFGSARFNKSEGSWIYTGQFSAQSFDHQAETLTPVSEISTKTQLIEVGLWNDAAQPAAGRDAFWPKA